MDTNTNSSKDSRLDFKLVGIGEVLWDMLPGGRRLGGAPANFACHGRALGAEARLVSRVGNDPLGREALERLTRLGVNFDSRPGRSDQRPSL